MPLGQFIIANQSQFPNLRIGNQIRHLEFNAQRNLSDASEDYFVKYLHTTVDKVMEEAAAFQQRIMQPKKETHAPPTSAPPEPPKRRVAIFVPCRKRCRRARGKGRRESLVLKRLLSGIVESAEQCGQ
jgi:hypothetical protein